MTLAIVFKGLAEKRNGNRIPGIMISQISDATFGNDLVGKQNEITKKSFEKRKRKKKSSLVRMDDLEHQRIRTHTGV